MSWSSSNKQHDVALSTVKAKYITTTSYATQTVCLERILEMMYQKQDTSTIIFCDNKLTITLCKNITFHGWLKHINTKFHKIRELITKKKEVIKHFL